MEPLINNTPINSNTSSINPTKTKWLKMPINKPRPPIKY